SAAWIRRLKKEGRSWHPLPSPSVPELRPNLKASRDLQWHAVKREIALAQYDLTLLPFVGPERRDRAAASGITRWDDAALSPHVLGFSDSRESRQVDGVLFANRWTGDSAVFPEFLLSNIGH